MFNGKVTRSEDVKDVIHIKVKKYAGYFNPEARSFAVDPHLTTFDDLQKILIKAFDLTGPFHLTYLCRDDAGENVFLSMLTDWDLDAAFMTSSDPHLRLKLDAEPYKDGLMSKMKDWDQNDLPSDLFGRSSNLFKNILQPVTSSVNNMLFQQNVQKSWINSVGGAFNKLTASLGYYSNEQQQCDFFPAKVPLDDAEFRNYLGENGTLTNPEGLRLRIYNGGVDPALRKVVWRLLLNIFPQHLAGHERIAYIKRKSDEYKKLRSKWQARISVERVEQISNMVWKDVLRTDRSHPFYRGPDDNTNTVALMNILTTFALAHPKVSYCQGMSDLVSPILVVMNNEAQAYICFCGLMRRLRDNFTSHGRAMSIKFKHLALLLKHYDVEFFLYLQTLGADNMFFCYRWILLEMKREFSFDDAITVLEVMWSSLPPQPPDKDLLLEDMSSESPSHERNDSSHPPPNNKHHDVRTSPEEDHKHNCDFIEEKPSDVRDERSQTPSSPLSSFDCLSDYEDLISSTSHDYALNPHLTTDRDTQNPKKDEIESSDLYSDSGSLVQNDVDFHNSGNRKRTSRVGRNAEKTISPSENSSIKLPPPEVLGSGNPFLLFVCLAVLLQERDELISAKMEYDDMVMHFDSMARKHSPGKILSRAMKLFAEYLRADLSLSST